MAMWPWLMHRSVSPGSAMRLVFQLSNLGLFLFQLGVIVRGSCS